MNDPDVKSVFFAALDLPSDQRDSYIHSACANRPKIRERVVALFRAHTDAGEFLGETMDATRTSSMHGYGGPGSTPPPERIGAYRVVRPLGHGGFGTVYLCHQQEPIDRQIAIKVLRPGMDTQIVLKRFEDERILLAKMDHPGIARVLDAGRTDEGLPYIAMEYIDGQEITRFCDDRHLTLRERIGLFAQACLAIQHAHQKGVIHRDIKPSNVLVTEVDGKPMIKVIDFGVSKAIDSRGSDEALTRTMQLVGTPQYMSPEQASTADADLDTRTDVYSLGVMLYELSTGTPPFDPKRMRSASIGQLEQLIRETDPQRPSTRVAKLETDDAEKVSSQHGTPIPTMIRQLRGEIDWIIACAMAKPRDRRYPSAYALYEDVQRVLEGEMVHARPPSRVYAMRKLIARNRAWASVGVLLALALITLSAISMVHAGRIKKVNTQIQSTLQTQEGVLAFTEQMLRGVDPAISRGEDTTLFRSILDDATTRVNAELGDSPDVEVRVRLLIGELYSSLGLFNESLPQFRSAALIAEETNGRLDLQTISARSALGSAYFERTEFDEAQSILEEVYKDAQEGLGPNHPDTLVVLSNLVAVYNAQGNLTDAIRTSERLLEARISVLGADHDDTVGTRNGLALSLRGVGENERARGLFEEVLEHQIENLGEDHPNTLKTRTNLAQTYQELDMLDRSIEMNEQILQHKTRVLGDEHPSVLVSMVNLATTLHASGDNDRAEPLLVDALEISLRTLGEEHQYTLIIGNNLASFYAKNEDFDQAIPLMRTASAGMQTQLGDQHPMAIKAQANLADVLIELGEYREALQIGLGIWAICSETLDPSDPARGMMNERVGVCHTQLGDPESARTFLLAAAASYLQHKGADSEEYQKIMEMLGP